MFFNWNITLHNDICNTFSSKKYFVLRLERERDALNGKANSALPAPDATLSSPQNNKTSLDAPAIGERARRNSFSAINPEFANPQAGAIGQPVPSNREALMESAHSSSINSFNGRQYEQFPSTPAPITLSVAGEETKPAAAPAHAAAPGNMRGFA